MNELLFYTVGSLSGIGIIAGGMIFLISKRFQVYEDPRIDEVEKLLPGANCGACGVPGCHNFAQACVEATDLAKLFCTVGGNDTMKAVAAVLGMQAVEQEPRVAVLRCNGSREHAPAKVCYQGAPSCLVAHNLFAGDSGCAYGCLGQGDCVSVCQFGAIHIDAVTGLPVVDADKCTACKACVEVCPRHIFELRPKGYNGKRVYVACMNEEKGAIAKKNCAVACTGCGRCTKVVTDGSVKVTNFLSYIEHNFDVDNYGPQIVDCCKTHTIIGVGIPPLTKPEASVQQNANQAPAADNKVNITKDVSV